MAVFCFPTLYKVYAGVVRVATALCPATSVQVELVAQLLGEFPLTDLHDRLLTACQSKLHLPSAWSARMSAQDDLMQAPTSGRLCSEPRLACRFS